MILQIFLSLFFLLVPVISYSADTGFVEGKVMFHENPMPGAVVFASSDPSKLFGGNAAPPVISGPDGKFKIELPRGAFYLAAMKKLTGPGELPAPGDLYAFYGGNPVAIDPRRTAKITINLMAKPENLNPIESAEKERGGVEGTVTVDGKPLDGVVVYVYLDPTTSFRGLGYYMTPPTGVNGAFKMKMGEGTYYLVARKRMNRELAGPLKEGDYFGYLDNNPLVVHKGKVLRVEFPVMKKVEKAAPGGQGYTVVSGIIRDKKGAPLSGIYACLYKNDSMTDRPAIVSKQTGADGVFKVEVPFSGKYYLGARSAIGRPLENGELWGRYSGNPEHSVIIETGKTVEGLDVTVDTWTAPEDQ